MRCGPLFAMITGLSGAALPLTAAAQRFAPGGAESLVVASGFEEGARFDLYVSVDYEYESHRAAIKREFSGLAGTAADGPIPVVKDLLYRQSRHTVTPRLRAGVFQDLELSVGLPIAITDSRTYYFDQGASPCVFPGGTATPTCINAENSTTILDGILPSSATSLGFDARTGNGFDPTGSTVFRGDERHGLDQVHLGVAKAILSQRRDDTKPTWIVGADFGISVGKIMKFERGAHSDGVSRGVHELELYTTMSRRLGWVEPMVSFWWLGPIALRDDSLFRDMGFGQDNVWPQTQAGTTFGALAIPWEDPIKKHRIAIEGMVRIQGTFEGRGYSEMWEPIAFAGSVVNDTAQGPLALDGDPTRTDDAPVSNNGITNIENYMTFGGRLGVYGTVADRFFAGVAFEMEHAQSHRITATDAGQEGPDDDRVITSATDEVNPTHVSLVDMVGNRYVVDESNFYTFLLSATFLF